tara:strand:+ start:70620 stop:70769 length:150 start_codon:yes stop_codon:yes gene_type:complete
MSYILAIDQGTTSSRAIMFDRALSLNEETKNMIANAPSFRAFARASFGG